MVRIHSVVAANAAIMLIASPALAHARLVSATPGNGATVSAPRTISLTFSERFAAPFSTVEVEDSRGRAVSLTNAIPTRPSADDRLPGCKSIGIWSRTATGGRVRVTAPRTGDITKRTCA